MKTLITLISAAALILAGCADLDYEMATVKINLGNIPIAKAEKKTIIDRVLMIFAKEAVAQGLPTAVTSVHLGAFDSNNQLLANKSISDENYPGNNIVEFDVPARNGVTIVVLGESDPAIEYYGKADHDDMERPLNLKAGETVSVEIGMALLNDLLSENYFNFRYTSEPVDYNAPIAWNVIFGASKIDLEYNPDQVAQNFEMIYSGSEKSCVNNIYQSATGDDYRIKLYFNFAARNTDAIIFNFEY